MQGLQQPQQDGTFAGRSEINCSSQSSVIGILHSCQAPAVEAQIVLREPVLCAIQSGLAHELPWLSSWHHAEVQPSSSTNTAAEQQSWASVQRDMTPQDTMLGTCFLTVLLDSIVYCSVWEYLHLKLLAMISVHGAGRSSNTNLQLHCRCPLSWVVMSCQAERMPEAPKCELS